MTDIKKTTFYSGLILSATFLLGNCSEQTNTVDKETAIDRQAVVQRHNPQTQTFDPQSPFTLGNGRFAFTADVTGLQSFPTIYFDQGIPLETKARWAWHSRKNPDNFSLSDTYEEYSAYDGRVNFPTNMNSAAGQWLRQNPHDLPLARVGFSLDGKPLTEIPGNINQTLDLWQGRLASHYEIDGKPVSVTSVVDSSIDSSADTLAVNIQSPLLASSRLAIEINFPRGYDLKVKNTPDILFSPADEHTSEIIFRSENEVIFRRNVDDSEHFSYVRWQGDAVLVRISAHQYRLVTNASSTQLAFAISFSQSTPTLDERHFTDIAQKTAEYWQSFWRDGAFADFSGSTNVLAQELERRIILSRYLMAVQSRASMPTQETGLTNSSWYGKHHSEMTWWHSAHWPMWGHDKELESVLDWYSTHLYTAKKVAQQRGLNGARWAKMVGPTNRESPGGNPLIIWNQPQFIHLAEMLYQQSNSEKVLEKYAELVEQSAAAMASMLVWDEKAKRFSLEPPIWIAQEIYDPQKTRNPTFELAYWRTGLQLAQQWRKRLGKTINDDWQNKLSQLAPLPIKDNKYVAIESIPDTFDNIQSRQDHPSMLAAYGLLNDPTVDPQIMQNTLDAVLNTWDWKSKIWGWDYPMIAMTAARLNEPKTATEILLADLTHNIYLNNGHVPQQGAGLRVYLPANGALLAAVAMMLGGWEGAPERPYPGFPDDGSWTIKTEGF